MKVTLISMDNYIISYGVRCISSYLKQHGFDVSVIFVRDIMDRDMPPGILADIADICNGSDIIGISLMTSHFLHSIDLTNYLKKRFNIPLIWGGIHPTFCPDESIKWADIVCIGEGEESLLELCTRIREEKEYFDVRGLWFSRNGQVIKTAGMPLIEELDKLPYPDYGTAGHFIRDGEHIVELTDKLFEKYLSKRKALDGSYITEYYISTSRGCPFKCSFCSSNSINGLYSGQKFHRLRSVDKVIGEVHALINRYSFIKWIYFSDDDIFASPIKRSEELSVKWKEKIGLPFYCTCYPTSYDERKMKMLVDAGLGIINIGIQSVSKKGCEVYERRISVEKLKEVVNSVAAFKNILPPLYDFILDNPYENDDDMIENLRFILEIPEPRQLQLFSLVPFPGTGLYKRMKDDGILYKYHDKIYKRSYSYPNITYINLLFFLANNHVSPKIIKALSSGIALLLFNNRFVKFMLSLIPYSTVIWTVRTFITRELWRFNKPMQE